MNDDPRRAVARAAVDGAWRAEWAKVTQDQTSVPLPGDGEHGDPERVSDELSADLGPGFDLYFADSDYLAMVEAEFRRLGQYGLLEGVARITDDPEDFEHDLKDRASGLYNTKTQELYIAPEEIIGEEPRERQAREGYFSTEKNFGSVWHELGHHWVRMDGQPSHTEVHDPDDEYWGESVMASFAREWADSEGDDAAMNELQRAINTEVSTYATAGGMEYVAETFSGLVAGNEYPQWVMDLYDDLGGYEPPEAARDPATAYEPMVAPSGGADPLLAVEGAVEAAVHAQSSPDPEDIGDVGVWELGDTQARIGGETYTRATWRWEDDEMFGETWAISAGVATDRPDTRTQVSLGNFDRLDKQTLYSKAAENGKPFEFARRFMELHSDGFEPGYYEGDVQDPSDQIHQDVKAIWEGLHGETEAATSQEQPRVYYHGTNREGAESILTNGIMQHPSRHSTGHMGDVPGFYMTPSAQYADDWDEAVVEIHLPDDARILDADSHMDGAQPVERPEWWPAFRDWTEQNVRDAAVWEVADTDRTPEEIIQGAIDDIDPESPDGVENNQRYSEKVARFAAEQGYDAIKWNDTETVLLNFDAPTEIRPYNDVAEDSVEAAVPGGVQSIPPGPQKQAVRKIANHVSDWGYGITVEHTAAGATVEFYPDGFPRADEEFHDNPSVLVVDEDGGLANGYFRYGYIPDAEWDADGGVGAEIREDMGSVAGTGGIEYDHGDFGDIVRPHLDVGGWRFDGGSGDVDWDELLDYGREFGERLADAHDLEASVPAGNFGEWPWSRDKAGLKACEEEMAGEVDNQYAFCRAWANEAGAGAQAQANGEITSIDDLDAAAGAGLFFADQDGRRISEADAAFKVNEGEPVVAVEDPFEDDPSTETYYHVLPEGEAGEVRRNGLLPSEATECPSGSGVHVTKTLDGAREWADVLRNERGVEWEVADFYEVRVPETVDVVEDVFPGPGPDESLVACTDFGIPPRFVDYVGPAEQASLAQHSADAIQCVTGDADLHPALRAAAVEGEFDGGAVTVDTRPVGDLGPWAEPGVPIADHPLMVGQGCAVRMPVEDFRELQTYIGTVVAPARYGQDVSAADFWQTAPERVDPIAEVLRGEAEPKEIYGGIPMPYVQIGSDGTLRGVQEGRHRTVAAQQVGLDTIPVRILYNEDKAGEGIPDSDVGSIVPQDSTGTEALDFLLGEAGDEVREAIEQSIESAAGYEYAVSIARPSPGAPFVVGGPTEGLSPGEVGVHAPMGVLPDVPDELADEVSTEPTAQYSYADLIMTHTHNIHDQPDVGLSSADVSDKIPGPDSLTGSETPFDVYRAQSAIVYTDDPSRLDIEPIDTDEYYLFDQYPGERPWIHVVERTAAAEDMSRAEAIDLHERTIETQGDFRTLMAVLDGYVREYIVPLAPPKDGRSGGTSSRAADQPIIHEEIESAIAQARDESFDRLLEDAAVYDDESVEDVLDEWDAMHVKTFEGEDFYAVHDPLQTWVAIVGDDYAYAEPFNEWIYDTWTWDGLGEWLDHSVSETFEDEFWSFVRSYHVTTVENAARIIVSGEILPGNETRGTGNRGVGSAVFLSTQAPSPAYGDVTFEVDVSAMEADGHTPPVEMEPAILEARQREAIAHQFNVPDFFAERPGDISADTVIFHDSIPIKYLSLSAEPDVIDAIEEEIRQHADGDELDAAVEWLDRQRGESPMIQNEIDAAVNERVIEQEIEASIGQEINDREFGLIVPKRDNSGQRIKPEIIQDIAHVITERFGGVTVYPEIAGCFIPDEGEMAGELMCEENVLITTIRDSEDGVPFPDDAEFLRNIGEEVGEDLGQISILVTEDRTEVEFVQGSYREELPDHLVDRESVFQSLL